MPSSAERYEEAMIEATHRHFAAHVAELVADGEILDLNDQEGTAFMWQMAEEAAEAELEQLEREARAEADEARMSAAYARMYA